MPGHVTAREYHERTKHSPESLRASDHRLDFSNKPTPYKVYRNLPKVELARRVRPPQIPTLTAIAESGADIHAKQVHELDFDALTQLCYYSAGVTKKIRRSDRDLLFRAAACTGALYHINVNPVAPRSLWA